MVKRRRRSWQVTGGGLTFAFLAWLGLAGCSLRADVARPLQQDEGGGAGQLAGGTSSGVGGGQAGGYTGGRPSQNGNAGKASGGSSGEQLGGAGEGGSGANVGGIPTVSEIMDSYRTWQPQSPEPVAISAYIFGLCRLPTLPEMEFLESEHGDGRYLQDWANAQAEAGIARRGAPPFDPGSVIVKEKYVATGTGPELVAIAMMIKREPGFQPSQGDWDYAYYEPELGVIQTKAQSDYCAGCHIAASETDFVFVDGLQPGSD